jgi:integrase
MVDQGSTVAGIPAAVNERSGDRMSKQRKSSGKKHQGTVTVRPNGVVQFRVMVNGRRITTYGRTEAEARAKAAQRLPLVTKKSQGVRFGALLDEFVRLGPEFHGIKPTTFDQYRYLLGTHVRPLIGNVLVESLTDEEMASVLLQVEGSHSTRRSTYYAIKKVLEFGVTQRKVGSNALRTLSPPRKVEEGFKRRALKQDESIRLLMAAKGHRWVVAVWLGLGAGMRRGEMLGLTWDDVDFESGLLSVSGNVTRSSAGLRRGSPKTRRGYRTMPMSPEVADALRVHRRRQAAERLAAGSAWVDSGHVLTNEVGGIGEPRTLSRVWAKWARQAGVEDTGTHMGRHFAATNLLASGHASVADIAEMLGHSPSVLLSTYASGLVQGQRAAALALGSALRAAE